MALAACGRASDKTNDWKRWCGWEALSPAAPGHWSLPLYLASSAAVTQDHNFKATETYSLTFLEDGSLKPGCQQDRVVWHQFVEENQFFASSSGCWLSAALD